MKKIITITSILLFSIAQTQAIQYFDYLITEIPNTKVLQISPRIGTDIGGAIPFRNIPKHIQPFPKLNIAAGLNINYIFNPKWHLGFDINYKTVGMSANAKMENEYFHADPTGQGGEKIVVYFSGIAYQTVSFTMLEVPLIAKYGFGEKGIYRLIFGAYGAWIMDKKFLVVAKTGYQGPNSNNVATQIKEPLDFNFSNELRDWEAGFLLGYEQRITSRVNADFIIYGGVNNIFKDSILAYGLFPMRLSISISYSLFNFS